MSIKRQAVQWTKYFIGAPVMLIATIALAAYLSGGEDIGAIGFPLLIIFVLLTKAYGSYLGLRVPRLRL
jgi:hypothetical protein